MNAQDRRCNQCTLYGVLRTVARDELNERCFLKVPHTRNDDHLFSQRPVQSSSAREEDPHRARRYHRRQTLYILVSGELVHAA